MKYLLRLFLLSAGLATPWVLSFAPFAVRASLASGLLVAGLFCWTAGAAQTEKRYLLSAGTWLVAISVASLCVSIFSYSAQVSLLTPPLLYSLVGAGILLPFFMGRIILRRGGAVPAGRVLLPVFLVLVTGSTFFASPARRYMRGEKSHRLAEIDLDTRGVREAVSWVHENIAYEKAPFTDTAIDTLLRGKAKCGGMANLLDKMLKRKGLESRIIHLEGKGKMHTLVEYRAPGSSKWVLADPQNNVLGEDLGGLSGYDLLKADLAKSRPRHLKGFTRLYHYAPGWGYRRVRAAG